MLSIDARLVLEARAFAFQAHKGQVRNNTAQLPFVYHLEEVARLVELCGGTPLEIAAAWLHDVLEDTKTTADDLSEFFGEPLITLVTALTDPKEESSLPEMARKERQAQRFRTANVSAQRIKVADQTANVRLVTSDPPIKWSNERCCDYLRGARLVARACAGASEALDRRFHESFMLALGRYPQLLSRP